MQRSAREPVPARYAVIPQDVERFFAGVAVGAGTVSVLDIESVWAASAAFAGFVLFLVLRWARLQAELDFDLNQQPVSDSDKIILPPHDTAP
jgi:hypothetical protein